MMVHGRNTPLAIVNHAPVHGNHIKPPSKTNQPVVIEFSKTANCLIKLCSCLLYRQSFLVLDSLWPTHFLNQIKALLPATPNHTPCAIIATSGSTGTPKLVCHSIDALFLSAQRSLVHSNIPTGDAILLSLSPSSMGGLLTVVKGLVSGAVIHLSSDHWLNALSTQCQWHFAMVPQQLSRFINSGLSSLTIASILIGGDAAPVQLKQQADHLPVMYSYGATETCGQIISTDIAGGTYSTLQGVSLQLFNDQLGIKTNTLAMGYLTASGVEALPLKKGFFISQDVVQLPPDFMVIGRKDFQFQSGAQLVSPEFIEHALVASGLVDDAWVVPHPHKNLGHVPVAYIPTLDSEPQLHRFVERTLPRHLRPSLYLKYPNFMVETSPLHRHTVINFHLNLMKR